MASLLTYTRPYGKPFSSSRPFSLKPMTNHDGTFLKYTTSLDNENEEKVVLNWLFRDTKEEVKKEVKHVEISPQKYGNGYHIMK